MTNPRPQMKLGLSIASAGYHYSAWRLPEVSALSGMDINHHIEARPSPSAARWISSSWPTGPR